MVQQQKNYLVPIVMMFFLFFIIAFVTGLQNPMGVILKQQFTLSNAQSQLGNLSVFLAYLFMGIPSGLLLERIGYKKTALLAMILGFLGVLIMFLGGKQGSFPIYLIGAFVSGFSMCLLNAVVNPMLTVLGTEAGANQRLLFGGALNSIGGTLAPILGGMVIGDIAKANISDADPLMYMAMGIFALVFLVLLAINIPEPHLKKADSSTAKSKHSALSFNHFKLGMVAIFFYVGIEVSLANTTNLYLTEGLGYDPSVAGTIVGTYWFLMLIGRLTGGSLGKIFTSKQMLTGVSVLGIILVMLSIFMGVDTKVQMPTITGDLSFQMAEVPLAVMFLILCGLCMSVMWANIFNLATLGLGKYTAQGAGFFMTMVVGGGVIPIIQGLVADKTDYAFSYWVVIICLAYLLFYALIGSKNINPNIQTEA